MRNHVKKSTLLLASFLAVLMALGVSVSFGQEEMSWEEYEATLLSWQQREMAAKVTIAQEVENIEKIKGEITAINGKIEKITQQMYTLLSINQADVDKLDQEIAGIMAHIEQLKGMTSQELEFKRDEIDGIVSDINGLKIWPAA